MEIIQKDELFLITFQNVFMSTLMSFSMAVTSSNAWLSRSLLSPEALAKLKPFWEKVPENHL